MRRVLSRYSLVNMGSLNGGDAGTIGGINIHGEVVGASFSTTAPYGGRLPVQPRQHEEPRDAWAARSLKRIQSMTAARWSGFRRSRPATMWATCSSISHGKLTNLGAGDFSKPYGNIQINNHGDMISFALSDGDASLDPAGKVIDLGSLAGRGLY